MTVKRSAFRMWLMALAGIPLLVISLDVLTNRRITNYLRELIFRPQDTQIFEPRDVIWAWVMLFFSVFVIAWGLKELFLPTKIIECRPEGLVMRLGGPLRRPNVVPWPLVADVDQYTIVDEGKKVPYLLLEFYSIDGLPEDPWGARWVADNTLAILAEDWVDTPLVVAEGIADYAVDQARRESLEAARSLPEGRDGAEEE